MRLSHTISLAASLATFSDALNLARRDVPRVVRADIQRVHVEDPARRDRLRRRQDSKTLQESLDNLQTLYFANASLGTPAQDLRLHLDTGSSDLWANAAGNSFCRQNDCSEAGTYSANDSSTYQYVNGDFNISYVDGSGASGDYAKDKFNFGGQEIDLQFGIGYESSSQEGILGIGYALNEVQVNRAGDQPYPNLPQALVDAGIIEKNAYSLWLNDLDANTGSILFGGVDTAKYNGQLQTVPILSDDGQYAEFIIGMSKLTMNGGSNSLISEDVPVLLDSGSSLMYLPNDAAEAIFKQFGASYDQSQGLAQVDCEPANSQDSLEFTFGGPVITVGIDELIVEAGTDRRGNPICILGVAPADGSTCVLGDTFLRSAYVVYDLQDNEIGLASTNFNATDSNIMEITNSTGIPDATGAANPVTSLSVPTGGARDDIPSVTDEGAAVAMMTPKPWIGAAAAGLGLLAVL